MHCFGTITHQHAREGSHASTRLAPATSDKNDTCESWRYVWQTGYKRFTATSCYYSIMLARVATALGFELGLPCRGKGMPLSKSVFAQVCFRSGLYLLDYGLENYSHFILVIRLKFVAPDRVQSIFPPPSPDTGYEWDPKQVGDAFPRRSKSHHSHSNAKRTSVTTQLSSSAPICS